MPWDWIVDETRSLADFTGAAGVQHWVTTVLEHARVDPWAGDAPLVLTALSLFFKRLSDD